MSRKTTPSGAKTKSSKKQGTTAKSKPKKASTPAGKASSRSSATGNSQDKKKASKKASATSASEAGSSMSAGKPAVKKAASSKKGKAGSSTAASSSADLLAKAEADINAAIESLNRQMSTALTAMTELAVSHQTGRGGAVIRTAPLDRATATFQRLVAQVVEEQVAEMLPPLIALREEMDQRHAGNGEGGNAEDDFWERGAAMLDQVLASAHVSAYHARTGEVFDPLIHLAVGETVHEDLDDGAVAEVLRPGFRTAGGKVIVPAKVKVNRR